MKRLLLAMTALLIALAGISTASEARIIANGTSITGIAAGPSQKPEEARISINGPSVTGAVGEQGDRQETVDAVILPSGTVIELR